MTVLQGPRQWWRLHAIRQIKKHLCDANGKRQQVKHPFNYKEVVKGNLAEQNILLQPGDVIVVPGRIVTQTMAARKLTCAFVLFSVFFLVGARKLRAQDEPSAPGEKQTQAGMGLQLRSPFLNSGYQDADSSNSITSGCHTPHGASLTPTVGSPPVLHSYWQTRHSMVWFGQSNSYKPDR